MGIRKCQGDLASKLLRGEGGEATCDVQAIPLVVTY